MTSTGDPRLVRLLAAVEQFTNVHNNWVADNNAEFPTIVYWDALDELIEVFNSEDIPASGRMLAAAVYELAEEKAIHEATENLNPHNGFWQKREILENLWTTLRWGGKQKYRESVKELDRQGVPHEQIARIWGLRHRDGSGNAALVARELEYPGSVVGPNYVHPDDMEAERSAQIIIDRHRTAAAAPVTPPPMTTPEGAALCPETSEELWLQKVPLPQAAKMLGRRQDDLAMEWKEFEQARVARKEAREQEVLVTTTVATPPAEVVVTSVTMADSPPSLESLAAGTTETPVVEDQYEPFADWTDDDIRNHARTLGLKLPTGRFQRTKLIDQILESESQAVEEAKQEGVAS